MSVDVHRGTDIQVSEKLLHNLWCCTAAQHVAGVGVPQHVEMEVFKPGYLFLCRSADESHRVRKLNRAVISEANEVDFFVVIRNDIFSGERIQLIVDSVFFRDFPVVISAIEHAVFHAVFHLLHLGFFLDGRQRVAEVYRADFLSFRGAVRILSSELLYSTDS